MPFTKHIDTIPKSYVDYYNENQEQFNSKVDIDLEDEIHNYVSSRCQELGVDLNLYMNYTLLKLIIQEKMKTEPDFNFGLLSFDFELYSEDEISELIATQERILVFDEKGEKTAVLLSVEMYEKIKQYTNVLEQNK